MNATVDTLAMIHSLQAEEMHPDFAEHLKVFEPCIGAWDVDVTTILEDGSERHSKAEWHFGWILGGRAMMDVWVCPPRSQGGPTATSGEHGCAIRFYDPAIQAWHYTWQGPTRHTFYPFIARQDGDQIILETSYAGGLLRWLYTKITPTELHWRSQESTDDGATWITSQIQIARRPA